MQARPLDAGGMESSGDDVRQDAQDVTARPLDRGAQLLGHRLVQPGAVPDQQVPRLEPPEHLRWPHDAQNRVDAERPP